MPGLARKLIICAAVDGLIIQPLSGKGQRPFQPLGLKYGEASVFSASREDVPDTDASDSAFEAFGIIGLITVSNLSYLISITRRQQVAQIFGYPVYVVTDVALTPCSSQADAEASIQQTSRQLQSLVPGVTGEDSDSSEDEADVSKASTDDVEDSIASDGEAQVGSGQSSVAEDVIHRRGSYGRFAQRWFSSSGWTMDQKRNMGMSNAASPPAKSAVAAIKPAEARVSLDENGTPVKVSSLLPKLLRTLQVLFGSSRSFYFSYDVDITRSLGKKIPFPQSDTPLYAQAESKFFWNRNILEPFLTSKQDAVALPMIQGFVGQTSFVVDSAPPQKDHTGVDSVEMSSLSAAGSLPSSPPVEKIKEFVGDLRASERKYCLTLISRRSTKRPGLRYLRRGIDEDGFVANMVETEQLLSPATWSASSHVHSFLQIRGSVPIYFTQTPYSLKPVPVLQHSNEANYQACRTHLERTQKTYGSVQIVNLVEQHGIEEPVGTRFQRSVSRFNDEVEEDKKVPFEWFDFHRACRGMKFENVSYLLSDMKGTLEDWGSTVLRDGKIEARQKGVLRTNCMDCLDRTNVCQSSFAKHMLEVHLKSEGIDMSAQADQETFWFNTIWADNGDAVSKQYASTAAMKGDYTRTKKRDYRGALNDAAISLTRFYSGMVNDHFSQAAIDFLLGNVSAKVFDEFEADMMTKDPAVSMKRMREQAMELCQKRVIADESEEFHGGWVLISPNTADVVKSWPMVEIVLLLTDAAMYLCQFDWNMDKVSSFERVDLANITHIQFGTYITSTISQSQMDELRNVGFVVSHQPGKSDIKRTNTRTLSTRGEIAPPSTPGREKDASQPSSLATLLSGRPKAPPVRKLAFKAPYTDSSMAAAGTGPEQSEIQQVVTICAEIERLAFERQLRKKPDEGQSIIEKGDIISLAAAKRNTGLLEQLGHSIKRLVWA